MSVLRTDVTAVCLHENFILAGIGHSVFVFNKTTCQFIKKLPALVGQKVHGFAPKGGHIAVSGGKQIAVVSLREECGDCEPLLKRICHVECDDWVLHTIWTNENTIAVLTAHNEVQVWNISTQRLLQRYSSEDNSILYSGLLEQLEDDLLVLAGTVFSQVIVHRCGSQRRLQVLEGHKGVIFSIAWDSTKEIIVTTSDDRSVRLWRPNREMKHSPKHKEYWEDCNMVCQHIVYGHLSRVMGCTITSSMIISVGEDSHVCFWGLSGKLLKKVKSHQNGCIWSLYSDSSYVVTGGSDCGVVLHPLSLAIDNCQSDTIMGPGTPKRIMFTARGNIVAYFATDNLCYFDVETKQWQDVATYDTTYKMMALSSCKQLLAIVDANGNLDVFIENCKNAPILKKILFRKLDVVKVCSLHWAGNRFLVVCSDDGNVTVASSDCERLRSFVLPACKERWLTAVNASQDIYVLGDRCGNVHFFHKDKSHPIKTFRKVHGNYGPTTISWRGSSVCSTGRDGTIKYFSVKKCDGDFEIKMKHRLNLPFQWVERFISDEDLVCGFNERNFVVHSLKDSRSMIDITCGGGHRAWDIRRYFVKTNDKLKEFIKLIYVKDSAVQTAIFDMEKITSRTVVSGTHVKEINCLKMFTIDHLDNGELVKEVFFVAGGEDTTLRLSSHEPDSNELNFCDRLIFKELSSIRSIALCRMNESEMLLISGGGRAKISIRVIKFVKSGRKFDLEAENIVDYQIRYSNKERKGNTSWKSDIDIDPETRIMSLQIIKTNNNYVILAGCSDSILRIYKYNGQETSFEPFGQINYHKTCILIVHHCENNSRNLVFTATTTGEIAVWDFTFVINESEIVFHRIMPIMKLNVRRSGINSLTVKCTNDYWLLATGGDDNTVHLILLKLKEKDDYSSIFEISRWRTSSWHNAQVTGLKFVDEYLISASIDQRITISKVLVHDDIVHCEYVDQLYTDVADVQGLEVSGGNGNVVDVCVYGKGIEVVNVKIA